MPRAGLHLQPESGHHQPKVELWISEHDELCPTAQAPTLASWPGLAQDRLCIRYFTGTPQALAEVLAPGKLWLSMDTLSIAAPLVCECGVCGV